MLFIGLLRQLKCRHKTRLVKTSYKIAVEHFCYWPKNVKFVEILKQLIIHEIRIKHTDFFVFSQVK